MADDNLKAALWYPPDTPHADDDEFDGTSIDPAWDFGSDSLSATPVDFFASFSSGGVRTSHNDLRPSWLLLQPDDQYVNMTKQVGLLPTNLLIWARVSFNLRDTLLDKDSSISLTLAETSGGSFDPDNRLQSYVNQGFDQGTLGARAKTQHFISGSFTAVSESTPHNREGCPLEYVAWHKIGNDFHAWVGDETFTWIHMGSVNFPSNAIDRVGFEFRNDSGLPGLPGNMVVGIDFIRFKETATFIP